MRATQRLSGGEATEVGAGPMRWAARICAWTLLTSASAAQGTTALVSRSPSGALANGPSWHASLSADGRAVAISSPASNLAPVAGSNHHVFVIEHQVGHVELADVSTAGTQGNQSAFYPSLSADGRWVAFQSGSTNLVPGDSNNEIDIFVRDRTGHATTRVSVSSSGAQADRSSYQPAISADGRWIAFRSQASNLVSGDSNGADDVFAHDLQTGATVLVSQSSSGVQGDQPSFESAISADGRCIAFVSPSTTLVAGELGFWDDVFVRDRVSGTTVRASVSSTGVQANSNCARVSLSADGRYVAFQTDANNLVAGDTNDVWDVFVRDLTLGTTQRVSVSSAGVQGNYDSGQPSLAADGGRVAFHSYANNLVSGDPGIDQDVFVYERSNGAISLESRSSSGVKASADCFARAISQDGRHVLFESTASNLVRGDTNLLSDAFVRDRFGCSPAVVTYCTAGTTSHGCVPTLTASGTPSASAGSGFTLTVSALEGQRNGIVFYALSGPQALPWGAGSSFLCLKPPSQRTVVTNSGGHAGACDGTLALDWNDYVAKHSGAVGQPFVGGETVWAQGWFRDPTAPAGSNLSDAIWFDVCP